MEKNKIKVLLIDDDEEIRGMYAEIFRQRELEVIEAKNGEEGFNLATTQSPDIILSGIIMPKMDGFTLKENLEKNPITAEIPFMILSHMGKKEDQARAKELGVEDFLIFGMITPLEIVSRIKAQFDLGEYVLQLNGEKLDAPKLIADLRLQAGMKCPRCLGELNLKLKATNAKKHEFLARLFCPKCEIN